MTAHSERRSQKPKHIRFFHGDLMCQRCGNTWRVNDLNESRKAVKCPICNEYNSIAEAKKRAMP